MYCTLKVKKKVRKPSVRQMSYSSSSYVIAEMPFSKKEFKWIANSLTTFIGRHPRTNCPVFGPNVSPKPSTSNPWRILK
jgi:hypothetical protein